MKQQGKDGGFKCPVAEEQLSIPNLMIVIPISILIGFVPAFQIVPQQPAARNTRRFKRVVGVLGRMDDVGYQHINAFWKKRFGIDLNPAPITDQIQQCLHRCIHQRRTAKDALSVFVQIGRKPAGDAVEAFFMVGQYGQPQQPEGVGVGIGFPQL